MKKLIVLFAMCIFSLSFAQIHLKGSVLGSIYSMESNNEAVTNYYPGLRLSLTNENWKSFKTNLFIRGVYTGQDSEFNERIYSLYVKHGITDNITLKAGRQFLFNGVVNGTMDGASIYYKGENNFKVIIHAGLPAPTDLSSEVGSWNDDRMLGMVIGGNLFQGQYIQYSTMKKWIGGKEAIHLDELLLQGYLVKDILYHANIRYNQSNGEIQRFISRLNYLQDKWSLSAELVHQLPYIYQISYFSRFEVEAYDQLRLNYTRQMDEYDISVGYNFTKFEDENAHEGLVAVGWKRNNIGVLYNSGFSGDRLGIYGNVCVPVFGNFYARFYANYASYQRYQTDISEEAVSFSGGLDYKKPGYLFRIELQQASNNIYKNDTRALAHFIVDFSY